MNSFTGGAEAVLVNRLVKWFSYESMFLGAWRRSRKKPLFFLYSTPNHCESMFLGASAVKLFYFILFDRKQLQTAHKADGEALSRPKSSQKSMVRGPVVEDCAAAAASVVED